MTAYENENFYLNKEIRDYIEQNYYQDLNSAALWNELFLTSLNSNEDLVQNIERFASNGVANLKKLTLLELNTFESIYQIFKGNSPPYLKLFNWYIALLCYLHNCYDKPKKTFFLDLDHNSKIEFFYHDYFKQTLQLICDAHKNEIEEIIKLFQNNFDFKIDKLTIIRELIVLPRIMHSNEFLNYFSKKEYSIRFIIQSIAQNSLEKFYEDYASDSFLWLEQTEQNKDKLHDILIIGSIFFLIKKIDYLCGSKKIFGYYQRLLDRLSGNVLYSIPYQIQMFLLKGTSAIVAGESNIQSLDILANNTLLINFKLGSFFDEAIDDQSAFNVAFSINEILFDCLDIFSRFVNIETQKVCNIKIYLETPNDNPQFAEIVKEQLAHLNLEKSEYIDVIPSLKLAPTSEKMRYLLNEDIRLDSELRNDIIQHLQKTGQKISTLPDIAFHNVKLIELNAKEILFNEGNHSVFVYIPLSEGLEGQSKTSKIHFKAKAWAPLGHVGVIQNDIRTATVVAEKNVKLLMIPGETYLRYWHVDYSVEELRERIINS